MKLFRCPSCQQSVFFDNYQCEACGQRLAFDPIQLDMVALVDPATACANRQRSACNWMKEPQSDSGLCQSCALNRYLPDLSNQDDLEGWRRLERAKRRLVYSLLRLQLPVESRLQQPEDGLSFDFINADLPLPVDAVATTGHASGQVTINMDEADPVELEKARDDMEERYRTLLGHMRHEIGHYYWERLVQPSPQWLDKFRQLFGDDRMNYQNALAQHYQQGAPANWQQDFISAYASSHPWEDWAETWAHYLHLIDTLETAFHFGLSVNPDDANDLLHGSASFDPYVQADFEQLVDTCLPVIYAVNSINRSLGHGDVYPFVLTAGVKRKMAFIHQLLWQYRFNDSPTEQSGALE